MDASSGSLPTARTRVRPCRSGELSLSLDREGRKARMITVGSVSRAEVAEVFPFLAERFSGRRSAIKELTHGRPDFVFWIR